MLQVTDIPALRRNSEILDTADLSQVNFVYNNITFQVYPNPKITNERSSGAVDVRLREDESDIYNFSQE